MTIKSYLDDVKTVAEHLGISIDLEAKAEVVTIPKIGNSPSKKREAWNKGKLIIDWYEKVLEKTDGRFELVSVVDSYDGNEKHLLLRCRTCGEEREISSISLRGKLSVNCVKCKERETRIRHIVKYQNDRADKIREQDKRIRRNLKVGQINFNFCRCGEMLLPPRSVCDICKRDVVRENYRKKDVKRRTILKEVGRDADITLRKLYQRDNGICYLCGKQCDWNDSEYRDGTFVVGRTYPTVEHIIPISKGGSDTWNNIKLACLSCNSKKGARLVT